MICDECETVAHCMKNGCVPKMNKELLQMVFDAMSYGNAEDRESARLAIKFALAEQPAPVQQESVRPSLWEQLHAAQPAPLLDLDLSTGFTFFDREKGSSFIGEVEMLKWLVENHSKDYWEHVAKEGKRK